MAIWGRIGSRGNVEDRRGLAPAAIGGVSLTSVALYLLITYLGGGNLGDALNQLQSLPIEQQAQSTGDFEGQDEYEVFVSTVLGSNNDVWERVFRQNNKTYTPPKLVLFRQATQSACGGATSDVGPHYCPMDETIYLDETFFDELTTRFGARGGDVAQAYVISHEVGHHVQNKLGIMNRLQKDRSNETSIKTELMADCLAGMWANSIRDQGVLEPNEIQEAMDAAAAVGDDRVQKAANGYVNPETWTHGSSQQRLQWFTTGYEKGSLSSCNTFK